MSENGPNSAQSINFAESLRSEITSCREISKQRIFEEIRHYPTPITACDQQFNYLLEVQVNVSGELRRLRGIFDALPKGGDMIGLIEEFVRSSSCLDAETKPRIWSRLREKL
jgi:hypothetical protein